MPASSLNAGPVTLAGGLIAAGALYLAAAVTWRQSLLFLVGAFAGLALYHGAFGFTSSWRALIAHRRGAGVRAQMLMLALTCALFFPLLARGNAFGMTLRGSVSPVGLSVIAGAFLFGVGMQLGGGCASGTLYTAGGGSVRMIATLAAFIAGSVLGAWQMPLWEHAPALKPISLVARYGLVAAAAISLTLFAAVTAWSIAIERRRHGSIESVYETKAAATYLRGPWPLVAGAVALAAVNLATLFLAGRPWGVTSAFALWGAKMMRAVGWDVAAWPYWQARTAELDASVFRDVTSVMNFGIILGALAAAGLAGRFAPALKVPLASLAAAIVGGLMLGYGARIAYGCNIGAYFSGIASSSVHGWVWFVAAFAGNIAGTRLRPLFGLRI